MEFTKEEQKKISENMKKELTPDELKAVQDVGEKLYSILKEHIALAEKCYKESETEGDMITATMLSGVLYSISKDIDTALNRLQRISKKSKEQLINQDNNHKKFLY